MVTLFASPSLRSAAPEVWSIAIKTTPLKLYARDEQEISEPILLWNLVRRLSQNTKPRLCQHADWIINLYNRVVLSDQESKSTALEQLRGELKSVENYLADVQLERLKARIGKAAFPSGVLLLSMVALGLHDFTSASKDVKAKIKASDGDQILIPGDEDYTSQMPAICTSMRPLKAEAVEAFGRYKVSASRSDLGMAQKWMQDYLNVCPSDAEAQIYSNNYAAHSFANQPPFLSARPVATLAVVAPVLRLKNGISDSFEMLRGISLAQFKTNQLGSGDATKQPILLVKIFNDGLPRGEDSDKEENKSAAARLAARSIVTDEKNRSIVGVVGHFSSGSTAAASRIYYAHNMPVISATSTNLREPLSSIRYRFNGVRVLHRLLSLTPPCFCHQLCL